MAGLLPRVVRLKSHDETKVSSRECQSPYELNGRTAQKRRTRDALVAAAREVVARGETPTVEAAAEAAGISRATAYRYFPNQHALLVAAHPETGAVSLLPEDAPDDVGRPTRPGRSTRSPARCSRTRRNSARCSASRWRPTPAERAQLPLRQGRGIAWIEEALAPLRAEMSTPVHRSLAFAASRVEALVGSPTSAAVRDDATADAWSARAPAVGAAIRRPCSTPSRPALCEDPA